jgi:hypothetical protein
MPCAFVKVTVTGVLIRMFFTGRDAQPSLGRCCQKKYGAYDREKNET